MSQTQLHKAKQLADELSADEKRLLSEYVTEQLQKAENMMPHSHSTKPQDLYGICFPDELDLDAALNVYATNGKKKGRRLLRSELLRR
jgi:hypothetical protein